MAGSSTAAKIWDKDFFFRSELEKEGLVIDTCAKEDHRRRRVF